MDIAVLKNGALAAWIKTVPNETNLNAFLTTIPSEVRSTVESSVRSAYNFADTFLDMAASKGAVDLTKFYQKLDAELLSRFDWIDDPVWPLSILTQAGMPGTKGILRHNERSAFDHPARFASHSSSHLIV